MSQTGREAGGVIDKPGNLFPCSAKQTTQVVREQVQAAIDWAVSSLSSGFLVYVLACEQCYEIV